MQPESTQLNIVTIINDTDNLISRINAHLEELESKYNIEGKKAPAILDGTVLKAQAIFKIKKPSDHYDPKVSTQTKNQLNPISQILLPILFQSVGTILSLRQPTGFQ